MNNDESFNHITIKIIVIACQIVNKIRHIIAKK